MRMPGMGELIIILAIVVLVFGANKLPQLGDGIGRAIKNFKRGLDREDELDVTPTAQRMVAGSLAPDPLETRAREAELAEPSS